MDIEKTKRFLQQLSSDTIAMKINWQHAYNFEHIEYNSNPNVADIFFQTEFRCIDFENSYYAFLPSGGIYIIFETIKSGRDGTHTQGDTTVHELPCPQGNIYQLINSIKVYMSKKEIPLENFVDSYLNDTQS